MIADASLFMAFATPLDLAPAFRRICGDAEADTWHSMRRHRPPEDGQRNGEGIPECIPELPSHLVSSDVRCDPPYRL
jgi:hypothetical protein